MVSLKWILSLDEKILTSFAAIKLKKSDNILHIFEINIIYEICLKGKQCLNT